MGFIKIFKMCIFSIVFLVFMACSPNGLQKSPCASLNISPLENLEKDSNV